MRLYHTTKHGDAIRRSGFRDGRSVSEGSGLRARSGVWLADRPITSADFSNVGDDVLVLEIPDDVVAPFEQPDDPLGLPDGMAPYRAFYVPAEIVNRYPLASDEFDDYIEQLVDDDIEGELLEEDEEIEWRERGLGT